MTLVPKCKNCTCTTLFHFRPISVLPTLSKILERVLFNQISILINMIYILTPHQSGFCAGHSTQDVLLYMTDGWLRAVDERKYTGAVFLDLAKAFDTVDHVIL